MAMFMIIDHQQTKNDGYFVKMTSGGNTNLYVSLVQCMILIFFFHSALFHRSCCNKPNHCKTCVLIFKALKKISLLFSLYTL